MESHWVLNVNVANLPRKLCLLLSSINNSIRFLFFYITAAQWLQLLRFPSFYILLLQETHFYIRSGYLECCKELLFILTFIFCCLKKWEWLNLYSAMPVSHPSKISWHRFFTGVIWFTNKYWRSLLLFNLLPTSLKNI